MVRETRHLWVGNLPENIREERVRDHFKRYGRVQSVKLLPRVKDEDGGSSGVCATVSFMDIKSAAKAHDTEHKLEDCLLTTEYHEPAAIPGSGPPPIYSSSRFQHGTTEEITSFERSSHFYERSRESEAYLRRSTSTYHVSPPDTLRGRTRDRLYRNGPYTPIIESVVSRSHRPSWSSYDGPTRYPSTPATPDISYQDERREPSSVVVLHNKLSKSSRSGSHGSESGSSGSRSRSSSSSSHSGSSSCSSPSSSHSDKSTTGLQSTVAQSSLNRPTAICVRNLPARSSDTSLKDGLFHEYKKYGKVTCVKVVGSGADRYGVVVFKKADDVEKALQISHDKLFFGCKIDVAPYHGQNVDDNEFRPYEAELDEYHPKATRTLFIGNLEKDITANELQKHFKQFGEIIEIDIKKQGSGSVYAFVQYCDIVSVVRAMRAMDGEYLGHTRINLGYGKSLATACVWLDGIAETVSEKYLSVQFSQFGPVSHVAIDRSRGHALVFFQQILFAQLAVNQMRGVVLRGRKLQVDFASRECQEAFYEHLEKFNVYENRTYEELGGDEPSDAIVTVMVGPPDIRHLQKERHALLEQLEDCLSSGEEGSSRRRCRHHRSQSGEGSRPGTPLCDERPENLLPVEPRKTPRDKPGDPLSLPLPRFASQVFSPRPTPPSPPASPPRPDSSSSDSQPPPSPEWEERLRSLDEKYEKWSGSRTATAKVDSSSLRIRHKLLDLDVHELQPSEIVKSVLARRSVFDEDSKRLENFKEKYEPKEFVPSNPPRPTFQTIRTRLDVSSPLPSPSHSIPKSPASSPAPAKGLQYPFPSHPPVPVLPSTSNAASGTSVAVTLTTPTSPVSDYGTTRFEPVSARSIEEEIGKRRPRDDESVLKWLNHSERKSSIGEPIPAISHIDPRKHSLIDHRKTRESTDSKESLNLKEVEFRESVNDRLRDLDDLKINEDRNPKRDCPLQAKNKLDNSRADSRLPTLEQPSSYDSSSSSCKPKCIESIDRKIDCFSSSLDKRDTVSVDPRLEKRDSFPTDPRLERGQQSGSNLTYDYCCSTKVPDFLGKRYELKLDRDDQTQTQDNHKNVPDSKERIEDNSRYNSNQRHQDFNSAIEAKSKEINSVKVEENAIKVEVNHLDDNIYSDKSSFGLRCYNSCEKDLEDNEDIAELEKPKYETISDSESLCLKEEIQLLQKEMEISDDEEIDRFVPKSISFPESNAPPLLVREVEDINASVETPVSRKSIADESINQSKSPVNEVRELIPESKSTSKLTIIAELDQISSDSDKNPKDNVLADEVSTDKKLRSEACTSPKTISFENISEKIEKEKIEIKQIDEKTPSLSTDIECPSSMPELKPCVELSDKVEKESKPKETPIEKNESKHREPSSDNRHKDKELRNEKSESKHRDGEKSESKRKDSVTEKIDLKNDSKHKDSLSSSKRRDSFSSEKQEHKHRSQSFDLKPKDPVEKTEVKRKGSFSEKSEHRNKDSCDKNDHKTHDSISEKIDKRHDSISEKIDKRHDSISEKTDKRHETSDKVSLKSHDSSEKLVSKTSENSDRKHKDSTEKPPLLNKQKDSVVDKTSSKHKESSHEKSESKRRNSNCDKKDAKQRKSFESKPSDVLCTKVEESKSIEVHERKKSEETKKDSDSSSASTKPQINAQIKKSEESESAKSRKEKEKDLEKDALSKKSKANFVAHSPEHKEDAPVKKHDISEKPKKSESVELSTTKTNKCVERHKTTKEHVPSSNISSEKEKEKEKDKRKDKDSFINNSSSKQKSTSNQSSNSLNKYPKESKELKEKDLKKKDSGNAAILKVNKDLESSEQKEINAIYNSTKNHDNKKELSLSESIKKDIERKKKNESIDSISKIKEILKAKEHETPDNGRHKEKMRNWDHLNAKLKDSNRIKNSQINDSVYDERKKDFFDGLYKNDIECNNIYEVNHVKEISRDQNLSLKEPTKDHCSSTNDSSKYKNFEKKRESCDKDRRKDDDLAESLDFKTKDLEPLSKEKNKSKRNKETDNFEKRKDREPSVDNIYDEKRLESIKKERRKERVSTSSLPASIGSKRRISSQDSTDGSVDDKIKPERRDSKDSSRSFGSSKKNIGDKHNKLYKSLDEKPRDEEDRNLKKKEFSEERRPKSVNRKESSGSSSSCNEKMKDSVVVNSCDKFKEKESGEKHKEPSNMEKMKDYSSSSEKLNKERKIKQRNDSGNTCSESEKGSGDDQDSKRQHSIFDIVDDGPVYISMYDKVKARSCKNMQKQQEERKQERLKEKFNALKQSRAKREEKKRSTSYDEDSDSERGIGRRSSKLMITSSEEDNISEYDTKQKARKITSESEDDIIRRQSFSSRNKNSRIHSEESDVDNSKHFEERSMINKRDREHERERERAHERERKRDHERERKLEQERDHDGESDHEREHEREHERKRERERERERKLEPERDHERESDHEGEHNRERAASFSDHYNNENSVDEKVNSHVNYDSTCPSNDDTSFSRSTTKKKSHKKKQKRQRSLDNDESSSKKHSSKKHRRKFSHDSDEKSNSNKVRRKKLNPADFFKKDDSMEDIFGPLSEDSSDKNQFERKWQVKQVYGTDSESEKEMMNRREKEKRRKEKRKELEEMGDAIEAGLLESCGSPPLEPAKIKKKKRKKSKEEKSKYSSNIKDKDSESIASISSPVHPLSPPPPMPVVTHNKKLDIPGFGSKVDENIHETAVKSISEAQDIKIKEETTKPSVCPSPGEEKPTPIISQEETEDAVAALLEDAFGGGFDDNASYTDEPSKPETPVSEPDLRIDTDTSDNDFDSMDFSKPPKTPDVPASICRQPSSREGLEERIAAIATNKDSKSKDCNADEEMPEIKAESTSPIRNDKEDSSDLGIVSSVKPSTKSSDPFEMVRNYPSSLSSSLNCVKSDLSEERLLKSDVEDVRNKPKASTVDCKPRIYDSSLLEDDVLRGINSGLKEEKSVSNKKELPSIVSEVKTELKKEKGIRPMDIDELVNDSVLSKVPKYQYPSLVNSQFPSKIPPTPSTPLMNDIGYASHLPGPLSIKINDSSIKTPSITSPSSLKQVPMSVDTSSISPKIVEKSVNMPIVDGPVSSITLPSKTYSVLSPNQKLASVFTDHSPKSNVSPNLKTAYKFASAVSPTGIDSNRSSIGSPNLLSPNIPSKHPVVTAISSPSAVINFLKTTASTFPSNFISTSTTLATSCVKTSSLAASGVKTTSTSLAASCVKTTATSLPTSCLKTTVAPVISSAIRPTSSISGALSVITSQPNIATLPGFVSQPVSVASSPIPNKVAISHPISLGNVAVSHLITSAQSVLQTHATTCNQSIVHQAPVAITTPSSLSPAGKQASVGSQPSRGIAVGFTGPLSHPTTVSHTTAASHVLTNHVLSTSHSLSHPAAGHPLYPGPEKLIVTPSHPANVSVSSPSMTGATIHQQKVNQMYVSTTASNVSPSVLSLAKSIATTVSATSPKSAVSGTPHLFSPSMPTSYVPSTLSVVSTVPIGITTSVPSLSTTSCAPAQLNMVRSSTPSSVHGPHLIYQSHNKQIPTKVQPFTTSVVSHSGNSIPSTNIFSGVTSPALTKPVPVLTNQQQFPLSAHHDYKPGSRTPVTTIVSSVAKMQPNPNLISCNLNAQPKVTPFSHSTPKPGAKFMTPDQILNYSNKIDKKVEVAAYQVTEFSDKIHIGQNKQDLQDESILTLNPSPPSFLKHDLFNNQYLPKTTPVYHVQSCIDAVKAEECLKPINLEVPSLSKPSSETERFIPKIEDKILAIDSKKTAPVENHLDDKENVSLSKGEPNWLKDLMSRSTSSGEAATKTEEVLKESKLSQIVSEMESRLNEELEAKKLKENLERTENIAVSCQSSSSSSVSISSSSAVTTTVATPAVSSVITSIASSTVAKSPSPAPPVATTIEPCSPKTTTTQSVTASSNLDTICTTASVVSLTCTTSTDSVVSTTSVKSPETVSSRKDVIKETPVPPVIIRMEESGSTIINPTESKKGKDSVSKNIVKVDSKEEPLDTKDDTSKVSVETPNTRRGRRRRIAGRSGGVMTRRAKLQGVTEESEKTSTEPTDIYEFKDDSDEDVGTQPRLILTIKSPPENSNISVSSAPTVSPSTASSITTTTATVTVAATVTTAAPTTVVTTNTTATTVIVSTAAAPAVTTSAMSSAASTRKSRRLQEKDGSRNTVDDTIDEVIRGLRSGAVNTRRSARAQNTTLTALPDSTRRSPRRKQTQPQQQPSAPCSAETSPAPTPTPVPPTPPTSAVPVVTPVVTELPLPSPPSPAAPSPAQVPPSSPAEPTTLIDPVTGLLIPMQESEEGQYIPVRAELNRLPADTNDNEEPPEKRARASSPRPCVAVAPNNAISSPTKPLLPVGLVKPNPAALVSPSSNLMKPCAISPSGLSKPNTPSPALPHVAVAKVGPQTTVATALTPPTIVKAPVSLCAAPPLNHKAHLLQAVANQAKTPVPMTPKAHILSSINAMEGGRTTPHQNGPMLTASMASPPLKTPAAPASTRIESGCIVVANPPTQPPRSAQVMQAGLPVPAYEASLGEVPHIGYMQPPHYVHHQLVYQQYLRDAALGYHMTSGSECEDGSASPPLELCRATDSPAVATLYVPRHLYYDGPPPAHRPSQPRLQVATPPHASQVPPQADSLLILLQRYPVMWQGLLALKNDQAAVQMHFVWGHPHVATDSLPCNSDGSTAPLRIAQRMRLEQTQLDGVARKMQIDNEHCMLLALPCGRDHLDVLQQSNNLRAGFITYLQQKQAAGIVNIAAPGSHQAAYVVHIFPSCEFANDSLARIAPDLLHRVADIAHLLIVIATV